MGSIMSITKGYILDSSARGSASCCEQAGKTKANWAAQLASAAGQLELES